MVTATFDEVVDFILKKAPPEFLDREGIASQVEMFTDMSDMLLEQIREAGPEIAAVIEGVEVAPDEEEKIRAAYAEWGVDIAKLVTLLGVEDEAAVLKLSFVSKQRDETESYQLQATKMYICGSLCEGYDVLIKS